jgi:hypothetical protein
MAGVVTGGFGLLSLLVELRGCVLLVVEDASDDSGDSTETEDTN